MDVIIRQGNPADAAAAAAIAVSAWEPIYRSYREQLGEEIFAVVYKDWRKCKEDSILSTFEADSNENAYIAEMGREIVGFVTFAIDRGKSLGTILNNAVKPDLQGNGIGSSMYDTVINIFKENGVKAVKVTTGGDPGHEAARRAYKKAGFNVSLTSINYYKPLY